MKNRQRPMSPYMLGPYYKFQLTSLLSITSRVSGVFLSVVTAPLALCWLIAVASGPEAYDALAAWMGGLIGQAIIVISILSISYHLMNGIRHLAWDAGWFLDLKGIYMSGYVMVIAAGALAAVLLGVAL